MLVLHGAWDAEGTGSLVLWAEPFGTPAHALAEALGAPGAALAGHGVAAAATRQATILVPARRGAPLPSPELVVAGGATPPHRTGRAALQPVAVEALAMAPLDGLDALLALCSDDLPVRVGSSIRALARVAELALEVTAGGRVAPALAWRDGVRVARWAPLCSGRDTERLTLLAKALPGAARALEGSPESAHVVRHAFDTFVDGLCRDACARGVGTRGVGTRLRGGAGRPATSVRSPADAWVAALQSPDGAIDTDPAGLAALERLVGEWRAPLSSSSSSWRLCFRLHEPSTAELPGDGGEEASTWRVELLLQAVDEPTLLVDAREVWRAGESLQRAARTVEQPQEVLLAELGRAVHAFGELARVLDEAAPTVLTLDLAGAHRFLSEVAPALELAGFGVLLPSWWRRPSLRLGLRVRSATAAPRRATAGRLTAEGLAAFDWEAALGDMKLGLSELRRLAKLKAPLVRVRGQWTELHPGEVQQLVDFLSAGRTRRVTGLADVLRAAAGAPLPGAGVPVVAVDDEGQLGALLRGELADTLDVAPTPPGFAGELRPYQRRGVAWLRLLERLGLGACLADDMGLGKTATVLGVLQSDRAEGVSRGPTLVVCPTSVVGNWWNEVHRFTPELRVIVHHGPSRLKGKALVEEATGADVVVTSYPLVERDRAALASVPWARLVLDEAQQVKNPAAKQTQAVRAIPAPRRLALTGTPVENHLGELWSIMEVVNPGLLGSQSSFRDSFAVPIERYGEEAAAGRLRKITQPFILRRLKTDRSIVPELPDKIETKERCALTREQATLYQAVVDEMLEKIAGAEGIERKGLVLATMLRLKQVCNHPAQYAADGSPLASRSGKLERTVEILEQVRDAGERALVFTQFAEMGALLQGHLAERLGCRVGFLHGGVPRTRRDALVEEIQSLEGSIPVLVLSLKAGGTGLNLTAASQVLHYDRWWNPAVEDQATDRAYRIGQRRDVQVRKLVCAGTVEDRIDEMIESKRALAARVVGTGEGWLTELSTDELADAIRLTAEWEEP